MAACLFSQHFWGEKHVGFDAMLQNFKFCYRTTGEFAEFLRESFSAEDSYYKALVKLGKQTNSYNNNSSFKLCWLLLKQLIDQVAQTHLNVAQEYQTLLREVQKYSEEQQRRQKSIKDTESSTQEVVHSFQVTAVQLQKAKETYHSRYTEYTRTTRNESSSNRDQEKLEAKLKKAQDEYKYSVEKYNNLRNQFVSKMYTSCTHFQDIEMAHLEQMREFMFRYSSVWCSMRESLDQLYDQFNRDLSELTTERLLNILVSERGTGTSEPQGVQFEDAEVAAAFDSPSTDRGYGISFNGGVRALEALFSREGRAASALAVVGSSTKENGEVTRSSLTDVSADGFSITSIFMGSSGSGTTKRREGFFRRRRNSLSQESTAVADANTTESTSNIGNVNRTNTSTNSLSAFSLVAKRGIRRFGTPHLNVKDKQLAIREGQLAKNDNWRTATPNELPKDEEGFSMRPTDPWREDSATLNDSDHSESDIDSETGSINKTFKKFKVNIRPVGELAHGIAYEANAISHKAMEIPKISKPTKPTPVVTTGPDSSDAYPVTQSIVTSPVKNHNLLKSLPIAPALPPPPYTHSTNELFSTNPTRVRKSVTSRLTSWSNTIGTMSVPGSARPRGYSGDTWNQNKWTTGVNTTDVSDLSSLDPLSNCNTTKVDGDGDDDDEDAAPAADDDDGETHCSPLEVSFLSNLESNFTNKSSESSFPFTEQACPTDKKKFTENSNWLAFDSDAKVSATESNKSANTWFRTNDDIDFVKTNPIPEPPARLLNNVCTTTNNTATNDSFPQSVHTGLKSSVITIAAAFTETWHARFHNGGGTSFSTAGEYCQPPLQAINGCLSLAFPKSDIEMRCSPSASMAPLILKIANTSRLKDLQTKLSGSSVSPFRVNSSIQSDSVFNLSHLTDDPTNDNINSPTTDYILTIPGPVLLQHLLAAMNKRNGESSVTPSSTPPASTTNNNRQCSKSSPIQQQSNLTYIKLDVLTYTVDVNSHRSGCYKALSPPIHLCTYWRCDTSTTDFRLDYTAQWPTENCTNDASKAIGDLRINLVVGGNVTSMQSFPPGTWNPEVNLATWNLPLSCSVNNHPVTNDGSVHESGTVRAKFTLTNGPGKPQPVILQFFRDHTLVSGVQLHSGSVQYRLSLCKRRLICDRYICDPPINQNRFHSTSMRKPFPFNPSFVSPPINKSNIETSTSFPGFTHSPKSDNEPMVHKNDLH